MINNYPQSYRTILIKKSRNITKKKKTKAKKSILNKAEINRITL